MRGDPHSHEFLATASLAAVLDQLAAQPGHWTPFAGGTEIMVQHAACRLQPTHFLNIWALEDLRGISVTPHSARIGAGVTFTEIRQHPTLSADFPLLAQAASWIGSIANQSRATLAGNIVNGSPAADAPPALLVYDATIELVSATGSRTLPYADFHTGYKRSLLRPDELVLAIHLPRRFALHASYLRKVGTRKAMAVTKVALAATAIPHDNQIHEIRLAAASLADRPIRLLATEAALLHQPLTQATIAAAQAALRLEAQPISDIRSTAQYRTQVAVNLLTEFLASLQAPNPILAAWNALPADQAATQLLHCCAATRWATSLAAQRPFPAESALFAAADRVWATMAESDWHQAFASHPRIGERKAHRASAQSTAWSLGEQSSVASAQQATLDQLAAANVRYEQLFGFTYIVCATGKSPEQMLAILLRRLANPGPQELAEAAEQQRQITQIRLRKWLNP